MRSAIIAIFLCLACAKAQDIILLGDSLSDNGNGYAATVKFVLQTNETYPQAPYYQGRWSNGPSWIEIAARQLSINLTDYGAAGATTGVVPAQVPPLQPPFAGLTVPQTVLSPQLFQQLNSLLLANNNTLSPNSYYFVFIGVNDFFATVFANSTNTAQQTYNNIQSAVQQLYAHGARKFVLVGNPTVSTLPVFTQPSVYGFYPNSTVGKLDPLVQALNAQIQQLVQSIPSAYPGASATFFDFGAAFMRLIANAPAYGITNTQQACYVISPNLAQNSVPIAQPIGAAGGQLCNDPDAHLFWDQDSGFAMCRFHPTRVVHEFVGASFVQQLGPVLFGRSGPAPSPAPVRAPSALPTLPFLPVAASG